MKRTMFSLVIVGMLALLFAPTIQAQDDGLYQSSIIGIKRFNPNNAQQQAVSNDTMKGRLAAAILYDTSEFARLPADTAFAVFVRSGDADTVGLVYRVEFGFGAGHVDTVTNTSDLATWYGNGANVWKLWQAKDDTIKSYGKSQNVAGFKVPSGATHFRVIVGFHPAAVSQWRGDGKVRYPPTYEIGYRWRKTINY